MNRDLAVVLTALVLMGGCAWLAIATASPPRRRRVTPSMHGSVVTGAIGDVAVIDGATEIDEATVTRPVPPNTDARGRPRPRIFTGEPAPLEPGRPAAMRALKLVGGLTAMALAGAVGLLVLVKGLVAMFRRISG